MPEPMSDERLALGKKLAVTTRKRQAQGHEVPIHTAILADAVDEIDRLRAENERLGNAFRGTGSLNPFRYIARLAGTNPYAIWDTGNPHCHFCMNIPALAHEKDCLWANAVRLAGELHLESPTQESAQ